MPKVFLSQQDKLNDRFTVWLIGKMKSQGITQSKLACQVSMSQQMFSYKLKNKNFLYSEAVGIINFIQPDIEEISYLLGVKG